MRIRGICSNPNCKLFEKEHHCDDSKICVLCKQESITIIEKEESFTPEITGFGTISKFKSLPLSEKKQALKKRSHEHYEKVIKDRANEMNKGNTSGMRE